MDTTNVISAFSEDHVERLTGVTKEQLRYWDQTDFFVPSLGAENRRSPNSRIYTFRDVLALKVLNALRNEHSVSLQHLRKVGEKLASFSEKKWLATTLFVLQKKVVFAEPGTERYREIISKQYVLDIPLKVVFTDTKKAIEKLRERDSNKVGALSRTPNINRNALVVAGTRIPVGSVKRLAEDGFSIEEILKEYPSLTRADVRAALAHDGDGQAA